MSHLMDCGVFCYLCVFFFKQKTAYEMRISDWSSDVCSSDLDRARKWREDHCAARDRAGRDHAPAGDVHAARPGAVRVPAQRRQGSVRPGDERGADLARAGGAGEGRRSEEHTSELQSLMRISYAVFCLKKKKKRKRIDRNKSKKNMSCSDR